MAQDLKSTTAIEKFSYKKSMRERQKRNRAALEEPTDANLEAADEPEEDDMTDMGITRRYGLSADETEHILDSKEQAAARKKYSGPDRRKNDRRKKK